MLEAKNVHKVYNNGSKDIHVLKGVDLYVETGKFVAIVGPSGAGKSTLLHILGGLDAPTRGRVILGSEDIYKLNDTALSRVRNELVGFVFQFYHLLSEFSCFENVVLPALIKPRGRLHQAKIEEKARGLLERVGLGQRLGHFPAQLSGGEQQRVAIVRALINSPQVLLCDEPTGNLDSQAGTEIVALLKQINAENKMIVVFVTHNPELAKKADQVYHLRDGLLLD